MSSILSCLHDSGVMYDPKPHYRLITEDNFHASICIQIRNILSRGSNPASKHNFAGITIASALAHFLLIAESTAHYLRMHFNMQPRLKQLCTSPSSTSVTSTTVLRPMHISRRVHELSACINFKWGSQFRCAHVRTCECCNWNCYCRL